MEGRGKREREDEERLIDWIDPPLLLFGNPDALLLPPPNPDPAPAHVHTHREGEGNTDPQLN